MEATTNIPASAPAVPGHVTRIARRRARPGQEAAYEALVREMFGQMRASKGFLAADLLPPEAPGGDYQVVINFASEADLAAWDACPARAAIHARMREVAEALDCPLQTAYSRYHAARKQLDRALEGRGGKAPP